jgi:hypothetical protein
MTMKTTIATMVRSLRPMAESPDENFNCLWLASFLRSVVVL